MSGREFVTLSEIAEQDRAGWPDVHPEDYCHRCGHRTVSWFTPWWRGTSRREGVLCARCFMNEDPETFWVVDIYRQPPAGQLKRLAALLVAVSDVDPEDASRVAGCVLDAGFGREAS